MLDPPWCTREQLAKIQHERDKMHRALREYHEANGMNMEPGKVTHKNLQGAIEEVARAARRGEEVVLTLEMCTGTAVIPPEKRLALPGVHLASAQRVSGSLRDRYLDHLREMYAQEYIDLDELNARMGATMSAKTGEELEFLLRDLPSLPVKAKDEAPSEKMSATLAYAMAAITMFVITILGSFPLNSHARMVIFTLSGVWAAAFVVLSMASRRK